jgi:drug/metabolite transporter (DMT)-like permease
MAGADPVLWGGWWAVFTLAAAAGQTFRNAMQRGLTATLGTLGATHVRFLFGLPFACVFLLGLWSVQRFSLPRLQASYWLWTAGGATLQILATALMLAAMRERSFVVTTAYVKTEPLQVAVFGLAFLGERLSGAGIAAVLVATAGVMAMSWPSRPRSAEGASSLPSMPFPPVGTASKGVLRWRPPVSVQAALLGIISGSMFAMSSVCFRAAMLTIPALGFAAKATLTLVGALSIQTLMLTVWLAFRSPKVLVAIAGRWRESALAGLAGAFASQMWFAAFAIEAVARVRALGLVEILFAHWVSRRIARGAMTQPTSPKEALGIVMVVAGVLALLLGL